MLISAEVAATRLQITMSSGIRFVPARAITLWPAHAVTPVASRDSLTTNSVAMKMTVGSPNPARVCWSVSTPVRKSASETPIATMPSGSRLLTKATIASTRMTRVAVIGSTVIGSMGFSVATRV